MHLDVQRRQWPGDETLGIQPREMLRSVKCLAPEPDVSALLATTSLLVNVVPFPGLKTPLATLMHAFIPQNDLTCCCR